MATAKDAQDLFNNHLPAALARNPDVAKTIGAVFQFKIAGDGGGEWTADLLSATPSCTPGLSGTPSCTILIDHSDFVTLLGNPGAGVQLFFSGKLKVVGDQMLAMKLQKLFSLS